MSQIIDERVVEMRFDNKQFEQGAKDTLSTLSKLKQALSFTDSTKALGELEKTTKNISLDGIASGIQALENRFSTLGIVGMRVIENLTDGMMNKLSNAVHFVTDSIVSGGLKRATNIENAHFQLQSLLKDETKVQAVMADAMDAVDGTAYAYDEAAKAAAQFSASGIQAGEDMQGALKGITGVAAMTNSSFEEISMIFTTVSGNGRLMGDQLLQLSSRGLNAASTLADYFKEVKGQASITEGAIREMVSKGQISFREFSDAMTWAFGDSAKRANETFNGALSNMKSALARIGAGFFSPFVEQNGEMVKLFNALRIQINNVKSALVFDEQTSAISGLTKQADLMVESVSKFAKDGTMSFDTFTNAILGTSKSVDDLDAANEALTKLFDDVKEKGTASVDTLIEFKKNGVSASQAIREYMNGVMDGSIKASDAVKKSIKDITGGSKVMAGDVVKLAEEGKISFDLLTDSIVNYSGAIKNESGVISDSIKNLMSEVKKNGTVTVDTLIEFKKNGMNAAEALRDYMDGVSDGSIRASYATKSAIDEITQGTKLAGGDIVKLAEEGKISYEIFQSAMENMYGDQKALSKQATDFVLDNLAKLVNAIQNTDLTKPMEAFYYGVESIKNVFKGLWTVVKPVGQAFADVFLSFSGDDMINFAAAIEKVTAKMRLSERGSKNLHDAFQGVFSVVKLLVDGFFKLIGVSTSVIEPVGSLTELFLELAGGSGRVLTKFTDFIRRCPIIVKAFNGLSYSFRVAMESLASFITNIDDFGEAVYNLPITQKIIALITDAFKELGNIAAPYLEDISNKLKDFKDMIKEIVPKKAEEGLNRFMEIMSNILDDLNNSDLSGVTGRFDKLREKIQALLEVIKGNDGINTFATNFNDFVERLADAFTIDRAIDNINEIKENLNSFIEWVKEILAPFFSGVTFGGALAAGSGIGMIYGLIKIAKPLEQLVKSIKSVPDAFNAMKNTLVAYQSDLKADALMKTAAAIAILSGALVLLSFADTKKVMEAALSLSLIAGVIMFGVSKFLDAAKKTKVIEDVLNTLSQGLASSMTNLAKAAKWKSIGEAVKNMGETLLMVAGTIIAIGYVYQKNPKIIQDGGKIVAIIGGAIMAMVTVMSFVGKKLESGMSAFSKAAFGVLAISMAMNIIIKAMDKLFKMEFPADYDIKLSTLAGILIGVAGLITVTSIATRIAGQNKLKSGPLVAVAALLYTTVLALEKLFQMDLPNDYEEKFVILIGIFAALSGVIVMVGIASRLAGGNMKAAGSLLAMCAVLGTIVVSLMILSLVPGEKLLKGAIALGAVLLALGVSLMGAGKIVSKDTYRTVLAMAVVVGAITASLGILSIVPFDKLLKASLALGSILLALAFNFREVAKVSDENAWMTILAMTISLLAISTSLYKLSQQPWKGMLAAGAAMSATLLAFGKSYQMILEPNWSKNSIKKIGTFLALTVSVIPIGLALLELSKMPWEGLLSAGASLSVTLMAFAKAFQMILKPNWSNNSLKKIGTFLALTTAVIPIGGALLILANQPWQGMLAAAGALSGTLAAFSICFLLISKSNPDLDSILLFGAATLAVIGVATGLSILANQPMEAILPAAHALSEVLVVMTAVMVACTFIGQFAPAALTGIGLLDIFTANLLLVLTGIGLLFENIEGLEGFLDKGIDILVKLGEGLGRFAGAIIGGVFMEISNSLPVIGKNLSDFWVNSSVFFNGISSIDEGTIEKVALLSGSLILFTGAELLQGLATLLNCDLKSIGLELSQFWTSASIFFNGIQGVDPGTIEAARSVAEMISLFTKSELLSGISNWLGFSGSMDEFGKELVSFGPSIASFAESVKGVSADAVTGATSAAKILAEMATELPAQEGLIQKIFGKKSLSDFGSELLAFAPGIVSFSSQVKDVRPEAVEGAASAAKIMAELATNLPNSGGLTAKIMGDNRISDFGSELVVFGPLIKQFADIVSGINPVAVLGVSTITSIMTELANNLPNTGGLVSWFSGDNDIGAFGSSLVEFGECFKMFYETVNGISTISLEGMIQDLYSLIELVKSTEGVNSYALSDFVNGLTGIATSGIESFCAAFQNSSGTVAAAIQTMLNNAIMAIQIQNAIFLLKGIESAQAWINGWSTKYPEATLAATTFSNNVTMVLQLQLVNYLLLGTNSANRYLQGIKDKYNEATSTGQTLANKALGGISSVESGFRTAGVNAGQGFVNGLKSMMSEATSAGREIAKAAYEAAKRALDEHSPSKKMGEVGEFAGLGFVLKLMSYIPEAKTAGEEIGQASMKGLKSTFGHISDMIDNDVDISPTIRPIVDLDDTKKSISDITKLFNSAIGETSLDAQATILHSSYNRRRSIGNNVEDGIDDGSNRGIQINYVQNNNSPKALSRVEIYRQTKSQLSSIKEELEKL